jgi:hypothetical protein
MDAAQDFHLHRNRLAIFAAGVAAGGVMCPVIRR